MTKQTYSPAVALEFFKAAGKSEKVAPGNTFFAELAERLRLLTARLK